MHRPDTSVIIDVAEQLMARDALAIAYDLRQPSVGQLHIVNDAALSLEVEPPRAYSSLPTRMQVRSSSHTTVARTLFRGEPRQGEIFLNALANDRQRFAERDHARELRSVPD
jgi:hypothetical protein